MMDVSFIIKTFERPQFLDRLISSIKKFYPDVPILVADDSKNPTFRADVEYYELPFDVGVSVGRNTLVNNVKTKYFITLDDDWMVGPQTDIEKLIETYENNDVDILAGLAGDNDTYTSICVDFKLDDDTLEFVSVPEDERDPIIHYCDFTPQFFITDTEWFKENLMWDEELKTRGEHVELFLRAKKKGFKTAITHQTKIYHTKGFQGSAEYKTFRKRDFFAVAMKKHGIKKCISFKGKERKF